MAYRLWNEDIQQGVTDFNDDHYHILKSKSAGDKDVSLVFDSELEIYMVGINTWIHGNMNALDADVWSDNFKDLDDAIAEFDSQVHSECTHPSTQLETVINYGISEILVGSRCKICGEQSFLHPEEVMNMGR